MSKVWEDHKKIMDEKYGVGKWHCDDIWHQRTYPKCVIDYLAVERLPAAKKLEQETPPLFADYEGKRVRIVMASRFGDLGISYDLSKTYGYSKRVYLPELSNFSDRE